jgi:Carbohydrate binding module (family 35)
MVSMSVDHRVRVGLRVLVLLLPIVCVLAAARSALADPAGHAAIVSGDARFEVLSPALVRTEYSGTGSFVDGSTFNVIGRDDFSTPRYVSSVHGGWLTIATSKMTLRYRVGSGRFTSDNLIVRLRNGRQIVTASPWQQAQTCTSGELCEAETATLNGVTVASDHSGYTGTGFAAGWQSPGDSLTLPIDVTTAGPYELQFRYANNVGGDGQLTTRTLSLVIDGGPPITLTMPTTASWDTWANLSVDVGTLTAGVHTIEIVRNPSDSGNVNIDSLALTAPGAPYPAAPSTVAPCPFGTVCSATTGTLGGGAAPATNHNGYTAPAGFVPLGSATASDAVQITGVPAAGRYVLQLRISNASGSDETALVGGAGLGVAAPGDLVGRVAHGDRARPAVDGQRHADRLVPAGDQRLRLKPRHSRGRPARRPDPRAPRAARRLPAQP